MKEPYVEGVANRNGPESCIGTREGDGEALTGERMGRDMEPRNNSSEVPTPFSHVEGNTIRGDIASPRSTSRGRRPLARAESSCARTGRSARRPRWMAPWAASERPEAEQR